MANKTYSAEDLALDKQFQQWVLQPDPALDAIWRENITKLKIEEAEVGRAKQLVMLAGLSNDEDANVAYLQIWGNLKKEADSKNSSKRSYYRYASVAAVLLALVVALVYLTASDPYPSVEYKTAFGEMREVLLQDGSKVLLNANSSITIKSDWKVGQKREVYLTGEAFFDVARTKELKPFIVHASSAVEIEVLGTEFNVNALHENQVEVYLHSGKVKVNTPRGNAEMKSGEVVRYNGTADTGLALHTVPSVTNIVEWRNNMFSYDDAELSDVVKDLEQYYGLDIVLEDTALNARRFTGKISRTDSETIFKVLAETLKLDFEHNGNQIIVRSAE